MFAVVTFSNEENCLAVVSKSWCTKNRCYWPPYKTQERLRKAVILHGLPDINTWEVFAMEILKIKGASIILTKYFQMSFCTQNVCTN